MKGCSAHNDYFSLALDEIRRKNEKRIDTRNEVNNCTRALPHNIGTTPRKQPRHPTPAPLKHRIRKKKKNPVVHSVKNTANYRENIHKTKREREMAKKRTYLLKKKCWGKDRDKSARRKNSVKINPTRKGAKESDDNPRGKPIGRTCKNKGRGEANKGKKRGKKYKDNWVRGDMMNAQPTTSNKGRSKRCQEKIKKKFDTTWKANKKVKQTKEKNVEKYNDSWRGKRWVMKAQKTSNRGVSKVKHVGKR